MNDGFILIHRKMLDWEWYSNKNDRLVWFHCLLKANWKDGKFKGMDVPRGSFVTTISNLVEEIGLTTQQIKTSINHLKLTNEITIETCHQFSIITINKYNDYQAEQQTNQQTSNKRVTNEQQTSNNDRIKEKETNKETISKDMVKKEIKKRYGTFANVKLSDKELEALKERFVDYKEKIERLSSYIASKGDKYKSHYATILNWARQDDKQSNIPGWFNQKIQKGNMTKEQQDELDRLLNF